MLFKVATFDVNCCRCTAVNMRTLRITQNTLTVRLST